MEVLALAGISFLTNSTFHNKIIRIPIVLTSVLYIIFILMYLDGYCPRFSYSLNDIEIAKILLGISFRVGLAQEPTKVDSDHYKVEFENDQVRVVRP